jgi:hypothetical protein
MSRKKKERQKREGQDVCEHGDVAIYRKGKERKGKERKGDGTV